MSEPPSVKAVPNPPSAIVMCAACACLAASLSWFKLASVDTGYHVAYGRHFLEHGDIVELDPFLVPETARPFINANWGSQVLMALAEAAGGAWGLIVLRLVLIAAIFTSMGALVWRETHRWHWVGWAWLATALAAYERFSLRPELFSYAILSVLLLLLMRGVRSWRGVAAAGVLQVAWVNLHSYFLVGILLTGSFWAGQVVRRMWKRNAPDDSAKSLSQNCGTGVPPVSHHRPEACATKGIGIGSKSKSRGRLRLLGIALLVQMGVCVINPWGIRGAVFPAQTLLVLEKADVLRSGPASETPSAWSAISEFHSPFSYLSEPICGRTIRAYLVLLLVAGVGAAALLWRGRPGPALAIVLLLVMSTQMRRNIAQFAVVAAPLAACGIGALPWRGLGGTVRRLGGGALQVGTFVLACWWIYGVAGGRFYYDERRITREFGSGYNDRVFATGATRWLARQPELMPDLFVDYFTSSNTLPWLPERFRLFVDTNTFAYGEKTLATAFDLGLGRIDHNRFFSEHQVNVVLLHCGPDTQGLVARLAADFTEWALVYFDPQAVVFVRRMHAHVPTIGKNRLSEADLDAKAWVSSLDGPAPARALILGTWANVPLSLGWRRAAAVLLEEAVRIAPDYHEGWYNLGVCHGNLGNAAAQANRLDDVEREMNAAARCFRTVLSLAPEHPAAAENLERAEATLRLMPRR